MKQILSISAVFIGLVIGAGFASGREIFEYFSIPSQTDCTGLVIATISFGAICYITMSISRKKGLVSFDSLIELVAGKLAPYIKLFMSAFMFCGFFVMMSACGALAETVFSIPPVYGTILLALVCFIFFSFDIKGLVACNNIMVPIMTLGMLFVCISTAGRAFVPTFADINSIKANPLTSAFCYVSYNTITAGAVLVPISALATRRQIISSSVLCASVLGILIALSWITMNFYFDDLIYAEIPLLNLASMQGKIQSIAYSLVLFMALCTTAVSHGFGLLSKIKFSKPSRRILASAVLCLVALPFSAFGFSSLVSKLYSAFGYLGFVWAAMLIVKYIKD